MLFYYITKITTINDLIRDEKLQYDINRKAAQISTKSSGKLHKYEYLTREEILPSNQQQIIEQARFTYSPLGQALEKQIKAIKDQGHLKTIKKYDYDAEDTPFISKQKEIFRKVVDERLEKITDLDKKVNINDLIYRYKGNTADLNFDGFDNAISLIDKIPDGKISLTDVKNNQETFKSYLGEIKRGNNKRRSREQKNALYNIETLYKARNEAIKFYDDYCLIMSEAKIKAAKGSGLEILTPTQMLQRLPIALAQVKAGNNSESLLN